MARGRRITAAVLGDGGWGTTLAIYLYRRGHRVRWWGAFPDYLRLLARRRENVKFLPGVRIPAKLRITPDAGEALEGAELVILAVPAQYLRAVLRRLAVLSFKGCAVLNVAKGVEQRTAKRMSEVIREELGRVPFGVLSGPNIAAQIARGQPASSVVASRDRELVAWLQRILTGDQLRIYTSGDVIGVELGGALKNPIAIAAGISDGLGFGANAKAALITRGMVEIARLGVALGARKETFWGLSGLGDLMTTCMAGRNRWVGEQVGRGKSLRGILAGTPMVIEGVDTTTAALTLGRRCQIELPIIEQVRAILFRGQTPRNAIQALMRRAHKAESVVST